MDTAQLAHALGQATGRREVAEKVAGELRRQAGVWRASEAKPAGLVGSLRSALLWATTERWSGRLEQLAAQVEGDLVKLRADEFAAHAAYEQAARAKRPFWRLGR